MPCSPMAMRPMPSFTAAELAARELTAARSLLACGDCEGLGRSTLEAYARDPRGVFAELANKALAAARQKEPVR